VNLQILHVDDDETFLFLAEKYFQKYASDFKLFQAMSANDGLAIIEKEQLDAIVCDFQMPVKDGLELLQELRNSGNQIPFIIFTGRGREEIAIEALNLGANYYVKKGGDAESQYVELIHIIRNVTSHHKAKHRLRESEERLRAIIDNSPDTIMLVDRELKIRYMNRTPSGREPLQFIGKSLYEMPSPKHHDSQIEILTQIFETGKSINYETKCEFDDRITIADVRARPVMEKGEVAGVTLNIHDITEKKIAGEKLVKALAEAQTRRLEQEGLFNAAHSVLTELEFAKNSREIFEICRDLIGAKSGYVALLSEDGTENEVLFLESGGLDCIVDPSLPMPIRGLRGVAYHTGKPVYDNSFMSSEWIGFMPEGHVILNNVMFIPLVIEGKSVGLIGLANKPEPFTDYDVRIASILGEMASIALDNDRQYRATAQMTM